MADYSWFKIMVLGLVLLALPGCTLGQGGLPTGVVRPSNVPEVTPGATQTSAPAPMSTSISTSIPTPAAAPAQYRALWVDAFNPGIKSAQEVEQLIREAQSAHLNVIVAQVRKRADAYYNQTFEPRASELIMQPAFDPLATLIQQAHAANPPLEVYAWVNALPISQSQPPIDANHIYYSHGPKAQGDEMWLSVNTKDGSLLGEGNYFLDPGHPAAAQYVVNVVKNVVKFYAVDGVHLDYIRYTGQEWGYNPISLRRYAQKNGTTATPAPNDPIWRQWRRDQVTNLMRQVYLEVMEIRPQVKVSAATIAWGAGPASVVEYQYSSTYINALQDWFGWMEEGILDIAFPMNYDREDDANQKKWFDQWIEYEKNHRAGRHLVIGVGAYLNEIEATAAQARRALQPSASGERAQGVCIYSYSENNKYNLLFEKFARQFTQTEIDPMPLFINSVRVPDMPWKINPSGGYLLGSVKSAAGVPADGVAVQLDGPEKRTLTTAGTGFYGAVGLPEGKYTVTVLSGTKKLVTGEVDIRRGQASRLDILLP